MNHLFHRLAERRRRAATLRMIEEFTGHQTPPPMKIIAAALLALIVALCALALVGCITTTHPDGSTTRQLDPLAWPLIDRAIPRAVEVEK